MIAIIGTTPDDILYFKTKMIIAREDKLTENIIAYVGKFAKSDCVVVACGRTNVVSSAITTMIIDKYDPYLIYNVGLVTSVASNAKQGDIFVTERVYLGNFNVYPFGKIKYYNIPEVPEFFFTPETLINAVSSIATEITSKYLIRGNIYSSDTFFIDKGEIMSILNKYFIDGNNVFAFDCESAGVYLACYLRNVSVISIKAISNEISNKDQLVSFVRKGLEVMPTIGKIITAMALSKSEFSSNGIKR